MVAAGVLEEEAVSFSSTSTSIMSRTKFRSSKSEKDNFLPFPKVARMLSDNPSSFGIFQPPSSIHRSTSVPCECSDELVVSLGRTAILC